MLELVSLGKFPTYKGTEFCVLTDNRRIVCNNYIVLGEGELRHVESGKVISYGTVRVEDSGVIMAKPNAELRALYRKLERIMRM